MPMNATSMLKANQTQTPNGTALNASAMLGLPGMGNNLQDDLADELKKRKQDQALANPNSYGAGVLLGAAGQVFGATK